MLAAVELTLSHVQSVHFGEDYAHLLTKVHSHETPAARPRKRLLVKSKEEVPLNPPGLKVPSHVQSLFNVQVPVVPSHEKRTWMPPMGVSRQL